MMHADMVDTTWSLLGSCRHIPIAMMADSSGLNAGTPNDGDVIRPKANPGPTKKILEHLAILPSRSRWRREDPSAEASSPLPHASNMTTVSLQSFQRHLHCQIT